MDETEVDNILKDIFTKEAHDEPCHRSNSEAVDLQIPEWFDEKKYEQGRRFFWDNYMVLIVSMAIGVIPVHTVPTILQTTIDSSRSNDAHSSFHRFTATLLHIITWFKYKIQPGSESWKSLISVRGYHYHANQSGKLKGINSVSQRDLTLTIYGFIGFARLKPEKFGLAHAEEKDWEAYNHLWRFMSHLFGIHDKYNICRKTVQETRRICQVLQDRVFTPGMEHVPEYFEHFVRLFIRGQSLSLPIIEEHSIIYLCKHLCDVPGYIYTESERIQFQNILREKLKGKPLNTGVDAASLLSEPAIHIVRNKTPRLLYLRDYEALGNNPLYNKLPAKSKFRLSLVLFLLNLNNTYTGRIFLNGYLKLTIFLMQYFPILAMTTFGLKNAFVSINSLNPKVQAELKTNEYFYGENNFENNRKMSCMSSKLMQYFSFSVLAIVISFILLKIC